MLWKNKKKLEAQDIKNYKKHLKIKSKYEKTSKKNIAKFQKKAKITKDDTYAEANEKIYAYVSKMKRNFYKVYLTDEQKKDPEFLLNLYYSNINLVNWKKPDSRYYELQVDVDFMINFIKLAYKYETKNYDKNKFYECTLKQILDPYKTAMSNPKFVEKLAGEFPQANIIELLYKVSIPNYYVSERMRLPYKKIFKNCVFGLPKELVLSEAKKHGYDSIYRIPNDLPYFNEVVGAGIEKDGFVSLTQLDIEQVLNNIPLIIKAYEKDGINELHRYIKFKLSPDREYCRMCHDEVHTNTIYDERYKKVQDALLENAQIKEIFAKEEAKKEPITLSEETKDTILNKSF